MRSSLQTLGKPLIRDIGFICMADAIVGASFGAIAVGANLPVWLPMLLSVLVFAGAAQFVFVGIVASGGNLITAVIASLLVNMRLVPLGFAIGDVLGTSRAQRLLGRHIMVDESVAFAVAQPDPIRRRAAYWVCGVGLFVCWNAGVLLGTYGGTVVSDPNALGLDAAFPAVLLALVMPSLRNAATLRAACAGVVIALATAPFLPAGLPVLLALLGVGAALDGRKRRGKEPMTGDRILGP